MIRLRQIEIDVHSDIDSLLKKCAKKLHLEVSKIKNYKINKKSLDARRKPNLFYSYEIDVEVEDEDNILSKYECQDIFKSPKEDYVWKIEGNKVLSNRPIIVGSGPSGLMCAYMLALYGYKPLVIERGEDIDKRINSVNSFWESNKLNCKSNIQFGEGGAGTFSDGKLNTLVKDSNNRQRKVFEIFVEHGASEEILYLNKPHIGTDLLCNVIKNLRNKIVSLGGEFRFNTCLTNVFYDNNVISEIEVNDSERIKTEVLVLAIGHSARDTYRMLYRNNLSMVNKSFAIGVRISHPQQIINVSQYSVGYDDLPAASYKLTYKSSNNRGVYTFCMCPGGYVINSSSEENKLVINGMSNHARDSENANSAIIVTIDELDYGTYPLAGLDFQSKLEEKAYKEGNGYIPIQLYGDLKKDQLSTNLGKVNPLFKGKYSFGNIRNILPSYVIDSLIEGIEYFDTKINGFAMNDAIIAAVESRTSSPVRILRNENYESNIKGIYPIGEGAGYAGGITSSAIDGIKIFEAITKIYKCVNM